MFISALRMKKTFCGEYYVIKFHAAITVGQQISIQQCIIKEFASAMTVCIVSTCKALLHIKSNATANFHTLCAQEDDRSIFRTIMREIHYISTITNLMTGVLALLFLYTTVCVRKIQSQVL